MKLMLALMIVAMLVFCTIAGAAQPQSDARALQGYGKTERRVTELEWNLLQFNLFWQGSFGAGEYVKSSPVYFDYQTMTFKTS